MDRIKEHLLVILAFMLSTMVAAQSRFVNDARDGMNKGLAKELKGTVLVVPVFLSEKETFPRPIISDFCDSLKLAQDWIQEQAALFEVGLAFKEFDWRSSPICVKIPRGISSNKAPFSSISPTRFSRICDSLSEVHLANNLVLIFVLDGVGRRHTLGVKGELNLEYTLLSWKSSSGLPDLQPSIIAHEILHQFGAIDLYYEREMSENKQLIMDLFPNEIMLWPGDLQTMTLSPITIYLIGWREFLNTEFINFLDMDG